jgi:hypothetical protein
VRGKNRKVERQTIHGLFFLSEKAVDIGIMYPGILRYIWVCIDSGNVTLAQLLRIRILVIGGRMARCFVVMMLFLHFGVDSASTRELVLL